MRKYNIRRFAYADDYGREIKLEVQGIELRDNTEEFGGYWDICLGKIQGFTLNESNSCNFFFETDKDIQLIGIGNVQCDGDGGYNLIGKVIS